MATLPVRIRPLICARSRCVRPGARRSSRRWDRGWRHHYLALPRRHRQGPAPCRGAFGETWLALIGFFVAARVQAGARVILDRVVGRAPVPTRHGDLIANNSRLRRILTAWSECRTWPSRVLGLSLGVLSEDDPGGARISSSSSGGDVRGVSRFASAPATARRTWRSLGLTGALVSPEGQRAGATTVSPRRSSCSD